MTTQLERPPPGSLESGPVGTLTVPPPPPPPSSAAELGGAASTDVPPAPPPPPLGEIHDSPAPASVAVDGDGWERVPVAHGGYKRRRVGEDEGGASAGTTEGSTSAGTTGTRAAVFERSRTRSTSGALASDGTSAAEDSASEGEATDRARHDSFDEGAPADGPPFGGRGGDNSLNSGVLSKPPFPAQPYPGPGSAGGFDVTTAHMVTDDRGALHMVADDHGPPGGASSSRTDAHLDASGKPDRKPRPRQRPGTYVAGGGTVGTPSDSLSERAAAARKDNEKWRHKPRRSQFRGVVWDQKAAHWRVEVRAPGGLTRINCGTWDDEGDAGRAYDREASQFPGKDLNFDPDTGEARPRNGPSAKKARATSDRPKIKKTRKPNAERSWGHHRDMDDMGFHSQHGHGSNTHGTRARSMSKDSSGSTTSSASGSSMYSYSSYDDTVPSNYRHHDDYPRPKYPSGGSDQGALQSLLLAAASMDDNPRRW